MRADRIVDRPMMLGDMLAAARKSAGRFQAWLEGSNPALAAQVVERAAIQGLSPAAYVRVAVADFASLASEEDWATSISRVRARGDPAAGRRAGRDRGGQEGVISGGAG